MKWRAARKATFANAASWPAVGPCDPPLSSSPTARTAFGRVNREWERQRPTRSSPPRLRNLDPIADVRPGANASDDLLVEA